MCWLIFVFILAAVISQYFTGLANVVKQTLNTPQAAFSSAMDFGMGSVHTAQDG